jgi:hypothetical protein
LMVGLNGETAISSNGTTFTTQTTQGKPVRY